MVGALQLGLYRSFKTQLFELSPSTFEELLEHLEMRM